MPSPRLRIIVGHRVQRELELDGPVTIGRRPDNDVVLRDDAVSGHHGRVEPAGEGWRYVDLGSMNGSLVAAGPRLEGGQSVELDDLTQILIGHTVLEYRPADEPAGVALEPGAAGELAAGSDPGADDTASWQDPASSAPTTASLLARTPPPLEAVTPAPLVARGQDAPDGAANPPAPGQAARAPGRAPPADMGERGLILTPAVEPPAELVHDAGGLPESDVDAARRPAPPTPLAARAADGAPVRPARLLIVLGGGVEVHDLAESRVLLGRSAECGVQVPHPSVSDRHLELRHHDGRWEVHDLGSTNGSRVGLAPLQGTRTLGDLNHVIVGAVDVLFLEHARPAQGDIDPERFVAWLRQRRRLGRRQAKACLELVRAEGVRVEEVLVRERFLAPGAITELRHNAERGLALGTDADVTTRVPAWAWALVAALAVALALSLWL